MMNIPNIPPGGGQQHPGMYGTSGVGGPGSSSGGAPGSVDPGQDPDDTRNNKGWRGLAQIVIAFAVLIGGFWGLIRLIDALGLAAH